MPTFEPNVPQDACPKCGVIIRVGDWPFCGVSGHGKAGGTVIDDSIPGGQWIENLGHEPMLFYSKRAIIEEADRRGLRLRDQWAGPGDTQLTNWAAGIDAQTLANAQALVSRGTRETEAEVRCETYQGSVRDIKALSEVA